MQRMAWSAALTRQVHGATTDQDVIRNLYDMKYCVQILALGSFPQIELSENEFNNLKKATLALSGAIAIEEKYELLLSNYLDLEKESLSIISEYMLRNFTDYSVFFDVRLSLNRRVVNLLTSTKLYIDQISQHIRACIPENESISTKVKSLFSCEYDSNFEYRFMDALRNYVQHRGLAVHSTSIGGSKRTSHQEDIKIEFNIGLYTHKSELDGDEAFKKQVYYEMPEKVELMLAVRSYIGSLSKVHCDLRELVASNSQKARELIQSVIKKYENLNNGDSIGLHAICSTSKEHPDKIVEKFHLLLDWDDVRLDLIKKNKKLANLKKMYVSGATL